MPEAPVRRARRLSRFASRVAVTALLLGLVAYPLSALIAAAASAGGQGVRAALDAGLGSAAFNSLWTAGLVTVIAVTAGLGGALLSERMAVRGRSLLRVALLAPLAVPPFVVALGWTEAYGPAGLAHRLLGFSLPGLFGPPGVVAVLAVEGLPLAYAVLAASLSILSEPDLERAARAAGATALTAFRTITLPLLRPALIAAAVLVFITSVNSFAVPQVLGTPAGFATLTTRIFQRLTLSADPDSFTAAIFLALVLLAIPLTVTGSGDALLAGREAARPGAGLGAGGRSRLRLTPTLAGLALLAAVVAIPLAAVVLTALTRAAGLPPTPSNWTLVNFGAALEGTAGIGLVHSLGLATVTATAVVMMGGLVAGLGQAGWRRAVGTAITATYALAGSGLALAVLLAYGRVLRYSILLILVAYLAKFWALGHRPLAGSAERIPVDLLRAARAAGAGSITALRTVVVPLLRPALAAAWLLVFLASLHELTISSLLYAPGSETLAVAVLNLQELGDVTVTAALAVILTALVLAVGGLLLLVRRLVPAPSFK